MGFRVSPWTWPVLTVASPVLAPLLAARQMRHKRNRNRAEQVNGERLERTTPLELPELDGLELCVVSEQRTAEGFLGEAGVSYLLRTELGSLLFDVGFGPDHDVMSHNATKLGITLDDVDALAISHLHLDHIGGMKAMRSRSVTVVEAMGRPKGQPCFLPDQAEAAGFAAEVVSGPRMLAAGIASTGPLARSLFFFGWTEEQGLVAHLRGKGLVLICGCGHPTIPLMLEMVSRISSAPFYALVGGLHFPVTGGRGGRLGLDVQTIMGTGKPPWQRITDEDLTETIAAIKAVTPARMLLSAHDSCDHALDRLSAEVDAEVEVLRAGERYSL
jgi:7,8-dihydropterin-6-yl-methyl-4-(beta-D-ribofuranosyl)aminobenzene 5'-phosphate synthase